MLPENGPAARVAEISSTGVRITTMTSQARIEANRRNAKKSTGPKTDEGKKRSRQNALKHGLEATTEILLDAAPNNAVAAEFERTRNDWLERMKPDDPLEEALLDAACRSSWRLRTIAKAEDSATDQRIRHAKSVHMRKQKDRVDALVHDLLFDPVARYEAPAHDPERKLPANPGPIIREIESMVEGVDWLLEKWDNLRFQLETSGYWHFQEKFHIIRMLGRKTEEGQLDKVVSDIIMHCHVAHPCTWDLFSEFFQGAMGTCNRVPYYRRVEEVMDNLPTDPEVSRTFLRNLMNSEISRLQQLRPHLLAQAERDRAAAETQAFCDTSPASLLMDRYATNAARELHRAVDGLNKHRKAKAEIAKAEAKAALDREAALEKARKPEKVVTVPQKVAEAALLYSLSTMKSPPPPRDVAELAIGIPPSESGVSAMPRPGTGSMPLSQEVSSSYHEQDSLFAAMAGRPSDQKRKEPILRSIPPGSRLAPERSEG